MGELIPLFKKTDLRFKLSAVQRLRFEGIRKELRLRNAERVAALIVYILLNYFEMKREGWTLIMLRGGVSAIVEIGVASQTRPPPGLGARILMRIIMAFEWLLRGLRCLGGARHPASELYLLSGKEYTIRCSRELYQKINKVLDYYREEGSPATIDRIMIQGTGLLEYYLLEYHLNERRTKPVELIFEKREEGKAMTWLLDDYLSNFK